MATGPGLRAVALGMALSSISCLSKGLKDVLLHEAEHIVSSIAKHEYMESIKEIETCPTGMLIGLTTGGGKSSGGTKRAPSAYNLWVKECVGEQKGDFKSCALAWRTSQKNPKRKR